MYLKNVSLYSIKLYMDIPVLIFSAVWICSLFTWVMHFVNRAQFLNATLVSESLFVAVISPVTRLNASE